ncbi:MAG: CpaF family protein, partial [Allosphingosinicella sp.]
MSAFGRRPGNGGASGGRPSFGVARPMKGLAGGGAPVASPEGGDQFPPLDTIDFADDGSDNFNPPPASGIADRNADATAIQFTSPI